MDFNRSCSDIDGDIGFMKEDTEHEFLLMCVAGRHDPHEGCCVRVFGKDRPLILAVPIC
jgi:hypothetical protein